MCGGDGNLETYFKDNTECITSVPQVIKFIESEAGGENLNDKVNKESFIRNILTSFFSLSLFFNYPFFYTASQHKLTQKLTDGGASSGLAKVISSALIARIGEIKKALVLKNTSISYAHLSDFDWSVRVRKLFFKYLCRYV
jgi:hypothetical protein